MPFPTPHHRFSTIPPSPQPQFILQRTLVHLLRTFILLLRFHSGSQTPIPSYIHRQDIGNPRNREKTATTLGMVHFLY